jgi:hypothetical protein
MLEESIGLYLNVTDEVGAVGDQQTALVVDPVLVQLRELVEHGRNVQDNAVAQDVYTLVVKDTAGEQVESVLVPVGNDSMAGVRTSVETRADIVILGQDVDELAFALVTPLGTQDDSELGLETGLADTWLGSCVAEKSLRNFG